MSTDWIEDDREQKLDLRLWRNLLRYTLHYRRTSIAFTFVAFCLAASDLCFPLITGRLIADVEANGTSANLTGYAWEFAILTVAFCGSVWAFITCAGKSAWRKGSDR